MFSFNMLLLPAYTCPGFVTGSDKPEEESGELGGRGEGHKEWIGFAD
jgi:hypothetical protein